MRVPTWAPRGLVALLLLAACTGGTESGGTSSDQTMGAIAVTTFTAGKSPDPDGYSVAVDGGIAVPIAASATVVVPLIPLGQHEVALGDVASNCTVDGASTRTSSVIGADTVQLAFGVTCTALTGELTISITVNGDGNDPDGFLYSIDGSEPRPIGFQGRTLTDIPVGKREVVLSGLADNCSGDTVGSVLVTGDGSAYIHFELSCSAVAALRD